MTFAGLAGVGDLIATCMSPLSRNRRAGELMASGMSWADAAAQLNGVAEGVDTVRGALELAERARGRDADRRAGGGGRARRAPAAGGRSGAHVTGPEG